MKVTLIAIGDHEDKYLAEGFALYEKRLQHYLSFDTMLIPSLKKKGQNKEAILQAEAKEVLKKLSPGDMLILLDDKGKEFTSPELANQLQKFLNMPGKRMFFLIGGAFGFAPEIYERAAQKLSLSKLTFNHQMARLFFLEQLYRSMTILKGEPYHH